MILYDAALMESFMEKLGEQLAQMSAATVSLEHMRVRLVSSSVCDERDTQIYQVENIFGLEFSQTFCTLRGCLNTPELWRTIICSRSYLHI